MAVPLDDRGVGGAIGEVADECEYGVPDGRSDEGED